MHPKRRKVFDARATATKKDDSSKYEVVLTKKEKVVNYYPPAGY